jgi:hypothetical protein
MNENKKRKEARGFFSQDGSRTHLAGCAGQDFHLSVFKISFKDFFVLFWSTR